MKGFVTIVLVAATICTYAQKGLWRGSLLRADGKEIVFVFEWKQQAGKNTWIIYNATERLVVDKIQIKKDSVLVEMPLFESAFRMHYKNGQLTGNWIKGTSTQELVMPFKAIQQSTRFTTTQPATANITGTWAAIFTRSNGTTRQAIASFQQKGNKATGTFLTPSGDYRYLEGVVSGDSLLLSCFDGSHAYLFTATIKGAEIVNGWYYSSATFKETWVAKKNAAATLPTDAVAMFVKEGATDKLNFSFPDVNGQTVSINDERFKNKVVVIQIMGSWCPNCMDETAFLSNYYNKQKNKEVEILALAYEYSTNTERSSNSIKKFQQRFNVQYPMLITGVTVNDSLRTEKTLPQLTPIKVFPTTIFLGKDGRVKKIDTGFYGPGTGIYYEEYKKNFYATITALQKE